MLKVMRLRKEVKNEFSTSWLSVFPFDPGASCGMVYLEMEKFITLYGSFDYKTVHESEIFMESFVDAFLFYSTTDRNCMCDCRFVSSSDS